MVNVIQAKALHGSVLYVDDWIKVKRERNVCIKAGMLQIWKIWKSGCCWVSYINTRAPDGANKYWCVFEQINEKELPWKGTPGPLPPLSVLTFQRTPAAILLLLLSKLLLWATWDSICNSCDVFRKKKKQELSHVALFWRLCPKLEH